MVAAEPTPKVLSSGILGLRLGCLKSQIDRLASEGKIPFTKAGRFRVFFESDFETIRATLVKAGYIQPASPVAVA